MADQRSSLSVPLAAGSAAHPLARVIAHVLRADPETGLDRPGMSSARVLRCQRHQRAGKMGGMSCVEAELRWPLTG
ncbi:hypothetical protein Micbo1qcDRAFT_156473 [Microdochium bolleyi]|uniref:Uncharacterized protein n=1 Tax=Microdochium bolleyi TaxID=196109 RepID=A0A136JK67_9PEZI|nr:hypothetical protein Micbo1qcDRAFT_156473 [Microdochium bolleyi]